MKRINQTLQRRQDRIDELSSMTGQEILNQAMTEACRKATMLISEGSVRMQMGMFALPQDIEKIRARTIRNV
jgi:hypothetical protein